MSLNINTQAFYSVLEVKKCGSISRAAQNLFISQPNLSTSIKSLEELLGFEIFERSAKGIIPTPEGALFIKSAEIIVSELDNIRRIPELCSTSDSKGLSVVCVYSPLILELFMQFINSSKVKHAKNTFKETGLNHAMQDIISKAYRVGFFYDFEVNHYKRIALAEKYNLEINLLHHKIPIMAYMNKDHPMGGRASINIEEFKKYPLVTYEDFAYEDWLGAIGIERSHPNILYIYDRGGMKESIRGSENIGISVGVLNNTDSDIIQIPIHGIGSNLNQYWVKMDNYKLNLTELSLIDFIKASLNKLP